MKKFFIIIVFVLIALPYVPTVKFPFLFDDYHLVIKNNRLDSLSDLKHYFTEAHMWQKGHASYFRPMMYSSLMLNYAVSKKAAWSYHLFNVIINLIVSLLVFLIAKNIFEHLGLDNINSCALFAAALFALHPLHSEVVANVAGRADSMTTFWILLGIIFSIKAYGGNIFAAFAVGICALAAGLTKETGFLFMPVILLYYFFFHKNAKKEKYIVWFSAAIGLFLAIVMYIFAMKSSWKTGTISYLDNFCPFIPFDQRIKTSVYLIGRSIKLLFIPWPLSSDYSFAQITPQLSFLTPYSAVAIIVIFCGLLYSWKRPETTSKKITRFAIFWFLLCYVFSSNLFFPIGTIFGERLLYLASVGFCVAAAWWIYQIKLRRARIIVSSFVLFTFITIIFIRNSDWKSPDNFYRAMRRTAPKSSKAHFASANLEIKNHNYITAGKHLNNALAIFPAFAEAHGLYSQVLLHEKNYSNAFVEATRAIRLNPNIPSAHDALAIIYRHRGNERKARWHEKIVKELMSPR